VQDREPYWNYMGRRLREVNMTDLINPSEYAELNRLTFDTISEKILTMRLVHMKRQLLELENDLHRYINEKKNDLKQFEMNI
jgi:hypothetical protein